MNEKLINHLVEIMTKNPELIDVYLEATGRAILANAKALGEDVTQYATHAADNCASHLETMMNIEIEDFDEQTETNSNQAK